MQALYATYLSAQPLAGIPFWWTDYGGCGGPMAPGGGDPSGAHQAETQQLWSTYTFATHRALAQQLRPVVLARYGGLGNLRYPLGFSGDTFEVRYVSMFDSDMIFI